MTQKVKNVNIPWVTSGGFFFITAILFFIFDKIPAGLSCLTLGLLLWLMANIWQLESFKGLGIEAKIRDLRDATDAADSTLIDLANLRQELSVLSDRLDNQSIDASKKIDEFDKKIAEMNGRLGFAYAMAATNSMNHL